METTTKSGSTEKTIIAIVITTETPTEATTPTAA